MKNLADLADLADMCPTMEVRNYAGIMYGNRRMIQYKEAFYKYRLCCQFNIMFLFQFILIRYRY